MTQPTCKTSAPGNLMLLGEHGVLHGMQALVCAVDKRMYVSLSPREDDHIRIFSALGNYESRKNRLEPDERFSFVLAVLTRNQARMSRGCDLFIESDFSSTVGLGSSAAVTVALTAAVNQWLGIQLDQMGLFKQSYEVIRSVQGLGSGADVAASVFGGVVQYRMTPSAIRKLDVGFPVTLVYSGHKEPTVRVVKRVEELRQTMPRVFKHIFASMDACVTDAVNALEKDDLALFGNIMNANQGLMDAIGVNTPRLAEITYALRAAPGILGA
ncbi:MAG: hypothetical protein EOM20_17855, partial [Spartobacteria bacterium]|nr:hypothetical protein [Spartobacteria bacterium]